MSSRNIVLQDYFRYRRMASYNLPTEQRSLLFNFHGPSERKSEARQGQSGAFEALAVRFWPVFMVFSWPETDMRSAPGPQRALQAELRAGQHHARLRWPGGR